MPVREILIGGDFPDVTYLGRCGCCPGTWAEHRSIPFAALGPLLNLPVTWYVLQGEPGLDECSRGFGIVRGTHSILEAAQTSDRDDSPWYPTMRLFRQWAGKWNGVIERVAAELSVLPAAILRRGVAFAPPSGDVESNAAASSR